MKQTIKKWCEVYFKQKLGHLDMQMKRAKSYNVKKLNPKWFGTLFTFDQRLKRVNIKQTVYNLHFPPDSSILETNKHASTTQVCRSWRVDDSNTDTSLTLTYLRKKIKSGEGGRGSYQSCVGQKQVRTSVLLSFKKIMKKETLNPRFFFHVNFRKVYTLLY